jgi:rhodanese-related sulfurtransferase
VKKTTRTLLGISLCAVFLLVSFSAAISADVKRMTKEKLKALLEKGDVVVLDVRSGRDWKSSEFKIQKAVRLDVKELASWAKKYPKEKTMVVYCA